MSAPTTSRAASEAGPGGGAGSIDQAALVPLVYEELRRLARRKMKREQPGLTLQPTALVHEVYLRLSADGRTHWDSRGHFFAAAAEAMRRILIERARRVKRRKHGGAMRRIELSESFTQHDPSPDDLLALDDALRRLEAIDSRKSSIVMLRYFAGLSIDETAETLELSRTTVKDEWAFARAWLHAQLQVDAA